MPEPKQISRVSSRFALPLLAVVVAAFCSPMFYTPGGFTSGDTYRSHDWFIAATHDAITRDTVLNHGQLPLRSHLVGGGYPVIGHPSDGSYSPFIITSLLLGERTGLKLNLIICLFLGGIGVFLLSREILRVPGRGPLLAALAFVVAGWHPSRTLVGYYEATFYLLFPLMLYLILMAGRAYRHLLLAVALSSACLMQVLGGAAAFGLWAATHLLAGLRRPEHSEPQRGRAMAMLVTVLGLAVLLGAVKFVPAMDLMGRGTMDRMPDELLRALPSGSIDQAIYKRTFNYYTTYRAQDATVHLDFFYSSPGALLESLVTPVALKNRYEVREEGDLRVMLPEYPFINVGYLVVGLGLLGLLLRRFGTLSSVLALLLFTVINFGWHSPVDLFRLLAYLPLVNEMARPVQYFNFFIYVELVLLAGAGFAWLEQRLRPGWHRAALLLVCMAALVPTALENTARYRQAFHLPLPDVARSEKFHQVMMDNDYLREQHAEGYGNTYLNVKRGVGSIVWDSNIKMPENAVPNLIVDDHGLIRANPLYRGEAWFNEPDNRVGRVKITPNRLEVEVKASVPGVLYINQNFHDAWSVETGGELLGVDAEPFGVAGELLGESGLLRVRCPAGKSVVVLTYAPASFYTGLAVSLVTLAALLWLGRYRRRWWRSPGGEP